MPLRPSAHTALFAYFLSTSSGVAFLLLQHARQLEWKENGLQHQFATFIRLVARSDAAMFLLVNWMFAATSMFLLATTMLFLGRLSARESSLLLDRLVKYCIFKLMFVSALKLPPTLDETAEWLAWFAVAGFMRIFIGMARDRLESLAAAPSAPLSAHLRAVALVVLILVRDAIAIRDLWGAAPTSIAAALGLGGARDFLAALLGLPPSRAAAAAAAAASAESTGDAYHGVSRVVLCAYDLAVVMIEGIKTLIKYGVHCVDAWNTRRALAHIEHQHAHAAAGGNAGAGFDVHAYHAPAGGSSGASSATSGGVLYHVELITDLLTHTMTIVHYLHMWVLHGCTFHLVDMVLLMDVRSVAVSLYRRVKTYSEYRIATYRLHYAFPDSRPGDDEPCSICMDGMQVAKQLPCGHHFHLACLRAWLQQSGASTFTCPNCRQPLLVSPPAARRPPTYLDLIRNRIQRHMTLIMLALVRMLEAEHTQLQQQLRQLRRQQEAAMAAAGGRRAHRGGSRRGVPAHEEPEGAGESAHPPPVSRMEKIMRRLFPWRTRTQIAPPTPHTNNNPQTVTQSPGNPLARLCRSLFRSPSRAHHAHTHGGRAMHEEGREGGDVLGEGDDLNLNSSEEELSESEGGSESGSEETRSGDTHETDNESDSQGEPEPRLQDRPSLARHRHLTRSPSPAHPQGTTLSEHARHPAHHHTGGEAGPSNRPCRECSREEEAGDGGALARPQRRRRTVSAAGAAQAEEEAGVVHPPMWALGGGSAVAARRARRALRRLGGLSPEMPMWSAGAVQQLAARVTRSIRSSLAHGDSRAAVAGLARIEEHEEVCSRRIPRRAAATPALAS